MITPGHYFFLPVMRSMEPRRQVCSTGGESGRFGAWGPPNQRFGMSKRISPKHCRPR